MKVFRLKSTFARMKLKTIDGYRLKPVSYTHLDVYKRQQ